MCSCWVRKQISCRASANKLKGWIIPNMPGLDRVSTETSSRASANINIQKAWWQHDTWRVGRRRWRKGEQGKERWPRLQCSGSVVLSVRGNKHRNAGTHHHIIHIRGFWISNHCNGVRHLSVNTVEKVKSAASYYANCTITWTKGPSSLPCLLWKSYQNWEYDDNETPMKANCTETTSGSFSQKQ